MRRYRKFNKRYSFRRRRVKRMSKAMRNNRKLFSSRGGFRF